MPDPTRACTTVTDIEPLRLGSERFTNPIFKVIDATNAPATISLWRFDNTLYVVTGTQDSLNLAEPLCTLEDVEGARSLTQKRINSAFVPTEPMGIFDLIIEIDYQRYIVESNGVLTPYPSDPSNDRQFRYVISTTKDE